MTSSLVSPQPASSPKAPPSRSQLAIRASALTPLWVFLIVLAARGGTWDPFFTKPPELMGIALGLWVIALVAFWMLVGLVVVWDTRSPLTKAVALMVFTIPATFLLIFAPAVILIIQNLG